MSVILKNLPGQPASNTFFDNNEATSVDSAWPIDGITVVHGPCAKSTIHTLEVCAEGDDTAFDPSQAGALGSYKFMPFRLRQSLSCNPLQFANDPKEFFDYLNESFRSSAHLGLAEAFWNGGPNWDGLVAATPTVLTPTKITVALGLLQKQMASTAGGAGGTIHMTPLVASLAVNAQLLYRRGQRLYTVIGDNLVITDGGYSGNGPDAYPGDPATASVEWIYATSPVYYVLGEAQFAAGFDITKYINRKANSLFVPVEADAIFFFDTCTWVTVPVDLTA